MNVSVIFMNNFDKISTKHTESIKYVISGAAPLGAPDVERFKVKAPNAQFFQGYGLTETSPMVLISRLGSTNYASVGVLQPDTEAKFVSINDSEMRGV